MVMVCFLPVLIMFLMTPKLPNLSRYEKTKHPPRAILAENHTKKSMQQTLGKKFDAFALVSFPITPPSRPARRRSASPVTAACRGALTAYSLPSRAPPTRTRFSSLASIPELWRRRSLAAA